MLGSRWRFPSAITIRQQEAGRFRYVRILATAGATNLLLVTFLIPVSALVLGNRVLGEPILARHLGGMALIACGLLAIDGRLRAGLRRFGRGNPAGEGGIS